MKPERLLLTCKLLHCALDEHRRGFEETDADPECQQNGVGVNLCKQIRGCRTSLSGSHTVRPIN